MEFVHKPYIAGDTIAAIATPPGEGGIAIIRISGKDAFATAKKLFRGPIDSFPTHTAHLGKIYDLSGTMLDEALLLVMRGPKSFTGEDTVEMHCHGGSIVAKKILEETLKAGARLAHPGEFSLKAFMNGKMDLAKAEATQQLISAKNTLAYNAAKNHLEGALSQKIEEFQKELLHAAAILEASVDFPEESLEFASKEEILCMLQKVLEQIKKLSNSFYEGKIVHEGLSLCLSGPPNAGKSSLMNLLLGKERAIVTEIAGTTRDILEDSLSLSGLHFRLMDTAGIRHTEDLIEKEGIKRSKEAMHKADLVLLVFDVSKPLSEESKKLLSFAPENKTLVVWNKADLCPTAHNVSFPSIYISALTGEGLDKLKEAISHCIWKNGPPAKDELILTSYRHKEALDSAGSLLSQVIAGLENSLSPEFISFDMRKCLVELGTILGMNISEEILSSIFSKFCIGK
jgi:tRNA modification GTPase